MFLFNYLELVGILFSLCVCCWNCCCPVKDDKEDKKATKKDAKLAEIAKQLERKQEKLFNESEAKIIVNSKFKKGQLSQKKQDPSSDFTYSNNHETPEKARGLKNLSNTCYLNSVIQCLLRTEDYIKWIKDNDWSSQNDFFELLDDDLKKRLVVNSSFKQLITTYEGTTKDKSVSCEDFVVANKDTMPDFFGNGKKDNAKTKQESQKTGIGKCIEEKNDKDNTAQTIEKNYKDNAVQIIGEKDKNDTSQTIGGNDKDNTVETIKTKKQAKRNVWQRILDWILGEEGEECEEEEAMSSTQKDVAAQKEAVPAPKKEEKYGMQKDACEFLTRFFEYSLGDRQQGSGFSVYSGFDLEIDVQQKYVEPCLGCGETTVDRYPALPEKEWHLSLSFLSEQKDQKFEYLGDMLGKYFSTADPLVNVECIHCRKPVCIVNKYRKLAKTDKYLRIDLVRFKKGGRDGTSEKIYMPVVFPQILDLKEYSVAASENQVSEFVVSRDNLQKSWKYSLYAVIYHTGRVDTGHYFAVCKDKDTNKWFCYNDTSVRCVEKFRTTEFPYDNKVNNMEKCLIEEKKEKKEEGSKEGHKEDLKDGKNNDGSNKKENIQENEDNKVYEKKQEGEESKEEKNTYYVSRNAYILFYEKIDDEVDGNGDL